MQLLLCFLWGISVAAIDLVTLTRMYTMTAFTSLLFTFAICKTVTKGFTIKNLLFIFFSAWFGIMSHLYFLIYAFILSALLCFYLMFIKDWKSFVKFAISMFAALVVALISNPTVINDFAVSNRSKEALGNLLSQKSFLLNVFRLGAVVAKNSFGGLISGGIIITFLGALIIANIVAFFNSAKNQKNYFAVTLKNITNNDLLILIISITTILYFVIITSIAPYQRIGYIACIIVNIFFLSIFFLYHSFRICKIKSRLMLMLLALFFIPLSLIGARKYPVHLYQNQVQINEAIFPYLDLPVVWSEIRSPYRDYKTLMQFKNKMFFTSLQNMEEFNAAVQSLGQKPFVLFLPFDAELNEPIKQFIAEKQFRQLQSVQHGNIWVMPNR
jgi:hypothetical protein